MREWCPIAEWRNKRSSKRWENEARKVCEFVTQTGVANEQIKGEKNVKSLYWYMNKDTD